MLRQRASDLPAFYLGRYRQVNYPDGAFRFLGSPLHCSGIRGANIFPDIPLRCKGLQKKLAFPRNRNAPDGFQLPPVKKGFAAVALAKPLKIFDALKPG